MDPRNPYTPSTERDNTATLGELLQNATDKASNAIENAKQNDTVQDVKAKATDAVETVKAKAGELSEQASDKADQALTATGEGMTTLANKIVENAPEGKAGEIAVSAAQALEKGGNYLRDADLDTIRMDLEQVIRERPIEALAVGVGIGFLLARATRR